MDKALKSYAGLMETINELAEAEVLACLELESGSRRRWSMIDRLLSRAVRLREMSYRTQLMEKFNHGIQESSRKKGPGKEGEKGR